MTYIYIIEKDNIPFYVGKTRNFVRRKHKHYNTYGNNIKLTIIDECDDNKIIWKPLESFWINYFKFLGFDIQNKNQGGGGPSIYSEEQKQKMRKPRKEGTGEKISKTLLNNNHSKYYTKEVKNKISNKLKGISKNFTEDHKNNLAKANLDSKGKTVECYNLLGEYILSFSCLREAADWLINNHNNVSKNVGKQIKDCCIGRQKTCYKYKWKYKDASKL